MIWPASIRAIASLGLIALLTACQPPEGGEMRGVLISVESREIINADRVSLKSEDSTITMFVVSSDVANNTEHANTASHLRQHMVAADPIIVRYRKTANGLEALRILDATPPSGARS